MLTMSGTQIAYDCRDSGQKNEISPISAGMFYPVDTIVTQWSMHATKAPHTEVVIGAEEEEDGQESEGQALRKLSGGLT